MQVFAIMRKNFFYFLTILLVNAVIMSLELVGPRIIAPFFGSTAIVWTGIISTILVSLCIGYYVGAYVVRKYPNIEISLSYTILLGAFFILLTHYLSPKILIHISSYPISLLAKSFLASIFIFSLPTSTLSIIPILISKAILVGPSEKMPQRVSILFSLGTLGALLGVCVTTFILIPTFGSSKIFYLLSILLIINSFCFNASLYKFFIAVLLLVSSVLFYSKSSFGNNTIEVDSLYNHIFIYNTLNFSNQEPIKVLQLNEHINSAIYTKYPDSLVFPYLEKTYQIIKNKKPLKDILMVGGGAYTLPNKVLETLLNVDIDVVEIDPILHEMAVKYFTLNQSSRLHIYDEDGRTFFKKRKKQYDVVFLDVLSSLSNVPDHLTTQEAFSEIKSILKEDGVVVFAMMGALEGKYSHFPKDEYKTLAFVFPHVQWVSVSSTKKDVLQNILLVASNSSIDNLLGDTNKLDIFNLNQLNRNIILKDDFSCYSYLNSFK